MSAQLQAGTSGYAYTSWRGALYPEKLSPKAFLAFYATRFPTVEINASFYRLPTEAQLVTMAETVPAGFTFAFKAPQTITHRKRLKECGDAVAEMWTRLAAMSEKLGPVLYGLPPNLKKDTARLAAVLAATPEGRRAAVEFRHASWFDDEVYRVLEDAGAALCIADADDLTTPVRATASWAYARLRRDDYTDASLATWRKDLVALPVSWAPVYFKHDEVGHASVLAGRFASLG